MTSNARFLGQAQAGEHAAHRRRGIACEVRVGDAGLLEVHDVEERVAEDLAHHRNRRDGCTRDERHAHADDSRDALGREQRELPHHHRAPVVPDEHGALFTDVVEEPEQVVGEVHDVVLLDRVRA